VERNRAYLDPACEIIHNLFEVHKLYAYFSCVWISNFLHKFNTPSEINSFQLMFSGGFEKVNSMLESLVLPLHHSAVPSRDKD